MPQNALEIQEPLKCELLDFLVLLDGIYLQFFRPEMETLALTLNQIPPKDPMGQISALYLEKIHQHIAGALVLGRAKENCLAPLALSLRVIIEARTAMSDYLSHGQKNGIEKLRLRIFEDVSRKIQFLVKTKKSQYWIEMMKEMKRVEKEIGVSRKEKNTSERNRVSKIEGGMLVHPYDELSAFIHPHYLHLVWSETDGGVFPSSKESIAAQMNRFLWGMADCYALAMGEITDFRAYDHEVLVALERAGDKKQILNKKIYFATRQGS